MSVASRFLFPSIALNNERALRKLAAKTIVITGATFGIGEALTRHLFNYPVRLILVGRTTEKLSALKAESLTQPAEVTTFTCDFYSEHEIASLCDKLKVIHIDYFVSNAGKSIMRSLDEAKDRNHDFQRTMAVNYLAPVQLISALIGSFREARTHIVNVSTYNVLMRTPPGWSAYVSSKKAMHSWIESNKVELAIMNITVSNIYLPLVESRMKDINKSYEHTTAMPMATAVAAIVKGLLNRSYHFKPWWHIPFQWILFSVNPFWDYFWYKKILQKH